MTELSLKQTNFPSVGLNRSSKVGCWLLGTYGPIVGGEDLVRLLGYPSSVALRQANSRGTVPVAIFNIPHRRGKFAFTEEVAAWLKELQERKGEKCPNAET